MLRRVVEVSRILLRTYRNRKCKPKSSASSKCYAVLPRPRAHVLVVITIGRVFFSLKKNV